MHNWDELAEQRYGAWLQRARSELRRRGLSSHEPAEVVNHVVDWSYCEWRTAVPTPEWAETSASIDKKILRRIRNRVGDLMTPPWRERMLQDDLERRRAPSDRRSHEELLGAWIVKQGWTGLQRLDPDLYERIIDEAVEHGFPWCPLQEDQRSVLWGVGRSFATGRVLARLLDIRDQDVTRLRAQYELFHLGWVAERLRVVDKITADPDYDALPDYKRRGFTLGVAAAKAFLQGPHGEPDES